MVRGDMSDDVKIRALLAPCQCRSGTCCVLVMTLFEPPYFLQVPGSEFIVAEDADTVDTCAAKRVEVLPQRCRRGVGQV